MGRQRNTDSEDSSHQSGQSEAISINSNHDSPTRKLMKKYRKSQKYRLEGPVYSDNENENLEKKRHKHKHKKHKREIHKHKNDHYEEIETSRRHKRKHSHRSSAHDVRSKHRRYGEDADKRNKQSSTRNEEENIIANDREIEEEFDRQQGSRWVTNEEREQDLLQNVKVEPNLLQVKTEPLSDEEGSRHEARNNRRHAQHGGGGRRDKESEKWGKGEPVKKEKPNNEPKETVNFGLSGKLNEDANTYNGVVIKYSQPPEARKPKRRWRWYIFKGEEELPFLPLHRQSAYLIGRERKVADIPTDHPSCSKQHAVFQYRLVSYERENGTLGRTVKPYILDLESANGTYLNNRRIDPKRFVELCEKDVVKFGYSSREYVLLHEASKDTDGDLPDAGAESTDLSPVSLLRSKH